MDWKTSTVTFAVQTDTSTIHEPEPVREPNVQMTIIKAYFSVICRSLWIIFLTLYLSNHSPRPAPSQWHHVATQPAFQIPQYTQTGPQSYIFGFDIIHNSSINSTSHFLSVSCTFLTLPVYISPPDRLTVHPSYICSVSLRRLYFIVAHLFSFFPCFFFFNHPSFSSPGWLWKSFSDGGRWWEDVMSFWLLPGIRRHPRPNTSTVCQFVFWPTKTNLLCKVMPA